MSSSNGTLLSINGVERRVASTRLMPLVDELGYGGANAGIAVALNDEVVPRNAWADQELRPGDRVEIVGAVQGG